MTRKESPGQTPLLEIHRGTDGPGQSGVSHEEGVHGQSLVRKGSWVSETVAITTEGPQYGPTQVLRDRITVTSKRTNLNSLNYSV